jgi:hypothetical protein
MERETNFILRINEQKTRLTPHEHDADDENQTFTLSIYLWPVMGSEFFRWPFCNKNL